MNQQNFITDLIYQGDCREVLKSFPDKAVDLIFADPPYNLQLEKELWRPNSTKVNGVGEAWDQFSTFEDYDKFTHEWLELCRRVLKDNGTIWVIGSYHNIFRVGRIMQDLGFWILNDVVWIKNNPMPNFRGVRFTNAHETLIWAQKNKGSKYTFNYQAMKELNHQSNRNVNVQMRSDWKIPICTGKERIKINGEKAHPTQKPETLLERVILASTNPGDLILDPFLGSGTTAAVAKKLGRHWIGIEADESYISIANNRIDSIDLDEQVYKINVRTQNNKTSRIPFRTLIKTGYLSVSQELYFGENGHQIAHVLPDGHLEFQEHLGSIHSLGREILKAPCNGWMAWYYIDNASGKRLPIDHLRKLAREQLILNQTKAESHNSAQ